MCPFLLVPFSFISLKGWAQWWQAAEKWDERGQRSCKAGVEQWTMSQCVKQLGTCSFSRCLFVDAIMACLWIREVPRINFCNIAGENGWNFNHACIYYFEASPWTALCSFCKGYAHDGELANTLRHTIYYFWEDYVKYNYLTYWFVCTDKIW